MSNAKQTTPDLPPEYALSRAEGLASAPKDFAWLEANIPCQAACPAGTDIPGYLEAIARGDYEEAYRINLRDNVFPAVLGRVCTRPCEPACRHGWEGLGDPVAICFSKRSADDFMQRREPMVLEPLFGATGKTVAVVGAGVAGLTVARELTRYGHAVTVLERTAEPGGLLLQGIPDFRLPRAVVEREIEQIRLTGVEIRCGVDVGVDVPMDALVADHDAVILSAGTHRPSRPALPGADVPGVEHGLEWLCEANGGESPAVGEAVVVIGGGFTAVDCARMAHRLGAGQVTMVYRRSKAEMYITPGEVEEMAEEGIGFEELAIPVRCVEEGGRVTGVEFVRAALGEPDASGRRFPEPRPGTEFTVAAGVVLLATGQAPDRRWLDAELLDEDGELVIRDRFATAHPAVFVTGDYATGAISLIDAIGHAKACARALDRQLMGSDRLTEVVKIEAASPIGRTRAMDALPREVMPTLPLADRDLTGEVERGLSQEASVREAERCYLCHYKFEIDNELCIYCDRCLKVKPVENCIVKVSGLNFAEDGRITGYESSTGSRDYNLLYLDQNECIRCGACVDVCPVDCITLQKVSGCTVKAAELGR